MDENKLYQSLQKTAFWMRAVGLIMGVFNAFLWYIVFDHAFSNGFGNDTGRAFIGVICLIVSTYATFLAFKAAASIEKYTYQREAGDLQRAFQQEAAFWTCLAAMLLGAILTIVLIITLGI